jgi:uncharacterized protein
MFGLLKRDIKYITKALKQFDNIEKAIIFGSRAMGNYKSGSDVDIAIVGKNINRHILSQISDLLNEEYPLPYFFDVINYNEINNPELKKHIDIFGIDLSPSTR